MYYLASGELLKKNIESLPVKNLIPNLLYLSKENKSNFR